MVARAQPRRAPALIIEDNPFVGRTLRGLITGRDVDLTVSCESARDHITSREYGSLFVDIILPDGNGLDLLAWARAQGYDTPALVMTGDLELDHVNEAQRLGSEFVFKPLSVDSVRSFLARCDTRVPSPSGRRIQNFVKLHQLPASEAAVVNAFCRGVPRDGLGAYLGISENTLKTTIRRLLHRTSHDDLAELRRALWDE